MLCIRDVNLDSCQGAEPIVFLCKKKAPCPICRHARPTKTKPAHNATMYRMNHDFSRGTIRAEHLRFGDALYDDAEHEERRVVDEVVVAENCGVSGEVAGNAMVLFP